MNDITLINLAIAQEFGKKVLYKHNSVGIFLLIASLERAGFKVSFSEYCIGCKSMLTEEIDQLIFSVDTTPSIIGIGCHLVHLPFAVAVAEELKKRFPEKKIILGGIGPSGVAKELLEEFSFIDAVVVGEAEETIVEVVKNKARGFAGVKGLLYRDNGRVQINAPRPHIEDLSKIPLPAYHVVDFKSQYEIPTVITSRGCPFACQFCSLTKFDGRSVRYDSIDNVIKGLKLLKDKYNPKYLFFVDPTFTVNKKRTLALCRRIEKENLKMKWFCMTRAECMDEQLMEQMARSGCETIFYGLDTGSDDVLKKIKRGFTVSQVLGVIKKSINYFNIVETGLMWGFPFETLNDFKETLKVRDKLENRFGCGVQLRWLEPYPATVLYRDYKHKLFLPKKYSAIFQPKAIQSAISKGKDFYNSEQDVSRIPPDVTSIRFVVAASRIADLCRDTIENNPHIFTDYYRYETPDLDEKLKLARKYSIY